MAAELGALLGVLPFLASVGEWRCVDISRQHVSAAVVRPIHKVDGKP